MNKPNVVKVDAKQKTHASNVLKVTAKEPRVSEAQLAITPTEEGYGHGV